MTSQNLKVMAGILWLSIGGMLIGRSVPMIELAYQAGSTPLTIGIALLAGLMIGGFKGKFMLAKSAKRNSQRIDGLPEPLRPWQVFPFYLYPLIILMIGFGRAVRYFAETSQLPGGWLTAGATYLGIGAALVVSSFLYFKKKISPL